MGLSRTTLAAIALLVPATLAIRPWEAEAGTSYTSRYTYEQTFGTAVRLVRVDLGFEVTEKDRDLGYLLFDYTSPESGERVTKGSLEVVSGESGVFVAVQLPGMPSYHEQMVVDALAKKLGDEHGTPPRKDRDGKDGRDPPGGKPDAGPDGG